MALDADDYKKIDEHVVGPILEAFETLANRTDGRFANLEAEVRRSNTHLASLDENVSGLNENVAGLNESVAGLNANVAGLNAKVTGLNANVADLANGLATANTTNQDLAKRTIELHESSLKVQEQIRDQMIKRDVELEVRVRDLEAWRAQQEKKH